MANIKSYDVAESEVVVSNDSQNFTDGFSELPAGSAPSIEVWDYSWINQGSGQIVRSGNALGSSYMKLSMCPYTDGSAFTMTSKKSFSFPSRFASAISMSQRLLGQEFEISLVGVNSSSAVETFTPIADIAISGTISVTSNVATINFATPHGFKTSDRVILYGNTDTRMNAGPALVTVVTALQITIPLTIANASYTAGGYVKLLDPFNNAKNAFGLIFDSTTATTASLSSRRNGASIRTSTPTIITTANATTNVFSDAFLATSLNILSAAIDECYLIPRTPDAITAPGAMVKFNQNIPDEKNLYKIRIRARNLSNFVRPIAKITAISKTASTTATVTTDVPHGLATTNFVQIYGVRDITNFPNLVAQTAVASIVSPTQFTVVIGSSSTTSSAGGAVFLNQFTTLAGGQSAINTQSLSRTNNVLTLIGNTTWTGYLPGETVELYGCDATSMGLYDGTYKVLRISTTSLDLESVGADFGSINCGGAVMRRTDLRLNSIYELEYSRLVAEINTNLGAADLSRSIPTLVTNTPAVTVSSGTVTTVSTVTASNTAIPLIISDVASAAITSTATTAMSTPTSGSAYQVNIPVTVVSGTNPTLDIAIEESDDTGTNWYKVYDFPRITATGMYRSPTIQLRGNRVRYVQTVAGTTPSFTRAINRLQSSNAGVVVVQLVDRAIVPNTISSTSGTIYTDLVNNVTMSARFTAQTTPATIDLQGSDDGTNWYTIPSSTITSLVGIVSVTIPQFQYKFARAFVTAGGTGITLDYLIIKGRQ